jgi:site-specific recombinase XerC
VKLSPTTIRNHKSQIEQIEQTIGPRLGKRDLMKLTPKQVEGLYGDMKDQGPSSKTICHQHAVLS